jgi:uncharacterized protein (TIGR03435 family)
MAGDKTERVIGKLTFGAIQLIWIVALIGVAVVNGSLSRAQSPVAVSPAPAPPPEFEVATIKLVKEPNPNNMHDRTDGRRYTVRNSTLRDLIMNSYELDPHQIVGGPTWVATDEYDIDAVAADGAQASDQWNVMLQKLLADRFKLTFHREQREMSVYALVVGKAGPKLKAADPNEQHGSSCAGFGVCTFRNEPIELFARWLQFAVLDKPVQDTTKIAGTFDFSLKWTPDESQFINSGIHVPPPTDNPNAPPGLFTAIQEQLGLKLEPQKIPSEVFVIDHVERPSEN